MELLNILVSITCFFLLLFSIHLFLARRGNKRNNILLAILFFARFGQILTSIVMKTEHQNVLNVLFQSFTPLYFAAPALFYLYVTGFLKDEKRFYKRDLLHLIPALLALIHVFPWPGSSALNWDIISRELSENGYLSLRAKNGLFPAYFQYAFRPVLILSYLALCWRAIYLSGITDKVSKSNPGRNWILFLLSAATFFQVSGLVPIALRAYQIPLYNSFFIALNCVVLLIILLYTLHNPRIFYGHLLVGIEWEKNQYPTIEAEAKPGLMKAEGIVVDTNKRISIPHKKTNLSVQQVSLYAVLMKELMVSDQLYLNPNLQIIDLATKMNIPVHHCSYVINNNINKNFRDWINGFRVEHFLQRHPLDSEKMTIEAIALGSGFKSLATFYNAFKKEKGMLPTAFFARDSAI